MRNYLTAAVFMIGAATVPAGAMAQSAVENRVDALEGQMRAVQRKVFPPRGNGQLVQPDIVPSDTVNDLGGAPSGSPVTDLTARVDALESQMRSMTGQIEQLQFKDRQREEGYAAFKRTTEARLKALEDTTSSPGTSVATPTLPDSAPIATTKPATTKPVTKPATSATSPTVTAKDPARAKLVAAVEKPATDDPGEDAYNYGYRLWAAKLYPEAEVQFKTVVKDYPQHRLISRTQNMLGRTLLDGGKPNLAVLAFYDNYRKLPKGERAHESLYYLAQALTKLNKPSAEVCRVYDELVDVYPDRITDKMKADIARGRTVSSCK